MQKSDLIVGGKIRRFSNYRIIEHQLNMTAFAILVITGLSQKFHGYNLSQWIIINLGGVDAVRLIHRYSGVCFAVLTIGHIIVASVRCYL